LIVYEKKEGISLYKRWVGIMRDLQLKDLSYKKSYSMNLNIKVGEYLIEYEFSETRSKMV
jgi:hypothetical protein